MIFYAFLKRYFSFLSLKDWILSSKIEISPILLLNKAMVNKLFKVSIPSQNDKSPMVQVL